MVEELFWESRDVVVKALHEMKTGQANGHSYVSLKLIAASWGS